MARSAKVFTAKTREGKELRTRVVVTTLAAEPGSKRYNQRFVERLSAAAQEFLQESNEANAYILINRPRD